MISAAGPGDVELLASLHKRSFDRPWSAVEIAKLMENAATFAILSQSGDAADGFALAWAAAGDSELLTVAVAPETRRRGLGAALVQGAAAGALARGATSMHLEVAEDNAPAQALYEKLGFTATGRRPAYYGTANGLVDAITMRMALG